MRVALYARVSSEKQKEKDLPIRGQLEALRDYAQKHGHTIVREYVDEAESGRTAHRPAFQRMIAEAKQPNPPFDAILVWKLSRFTRNRFDSIVYKNLLRNRGIQIISINEPIDDTPSGRFLEAIIEVVDEFHSINLAQDVRRGMTEAAKRGFWVSGQTPYGYQRIHIRDGTTRRAKLVIDPNTAPVVRQIFDLCLKGYGIKEIAKTLNTQGIPSPNGKPWGKTTVAKILRNEVYTGTLVWGRRPQYGFDPVRVPNAVPPIIDEDAFKRAQELIAQRSPLLEHPRRTTSPYLLSGLLFCTTCKSPLSGHSAKSGRHHYYACNSRIRGRSSCNTPLIPKQTIEDFILTRICSHLLTPQHISDLLRLLNRELKRYKKDYKDQLATLEAQLANLNKRLDRLYDALETGKLNLDDVAPRIKAIRHQQTSIQEQIALIRDRIAHPPMQLSNKDLKQILTNLKELLNSGTPQQRRAFLKSMIKRIEIESNQITIHYFLPPYFSTRREKAVWPTAHSAGPKDGGENEVLPMSYIGGVMCTACAPDGAKVVLTMVSPPSLLG